MKITGNRIEILGFVSIFICLLGAGSCSRDEEVAGPEYPEAREIVYSFRLQNNLGREIPTANIGLYLPMARSSNQNLLDFTVSGTLDASYRHLEDEAGNSSVFYELKDLPPDFTKAVKLKARVGFAATPHEVDVPGLERYLEVPASGDQAEGNAPAIEFSAEDDTKAKLLKIAAAVSSPNSGQDQNAQTDIAASSDDCIERIGKFARYARLNNIAVRPVIGFRASTAADGGEQKPRYELHCWAEYYDQNRWHTLDVMKGAPVEDIKEYLAVRSFISLQDLLQQTVTSLMAQGYGLTITLDTVE